MAKAHATAPRSLYELAQEAGTYFESFQRQGEDAYGQRVRDGAPSWITDMVRSAHGDMLPDDYRYATIRDALDYLAETDDDTDLEELGHSFEDAADVYTCDLLRWLGSNAVRVCYVDDAIREVAGIRDLGSFIDGENAGIVKLIVTGQCYERREIFAAVLQVLQAHADAEAERLLSVRVELRNDAADWREEIGWGLTTD